MSPNRIARSSLSVPLIKTAILAATGNESALKRHLAAPATHLVNTGKLTEALLEVHLFAGFPASIEAMFSLLRMRPTKHNAVARKKQKRPQKGELLMRKVYGRDYVKVSRAMARLNPDLASWIVNYGYGTVLSRRGLTLKERELVAIGVLAVLGWERQLRSHIRGARTLHIPASHIRHVLNLARECLPAHNRRRKHVTIQRLAREVEGKSP